MLYILKEHRTPIYLGRCGHVECSNIDSYKCEKRYFTLRINGMLGVRNVGICKEYLRELYREYRDIDAVIRYLTGFDSSEYNYRNQIWVQICDRPVVHAWLSFKHVCDMHIESIYDPDMLETIVSACDNWLYDKGKYKKYQAQANELKALLRKLKHAYGEDAKRNMFIEIAQCMYKITIANETHKQQITSALHF